MSNQEPVHHDAPVEVPPVSEQPNDAHLAKMPSEIILSIAEHMDRQSLKRLALTSSKLHHTVRSEFYRSFNYETFRLALKGGDFDMIQRCIMHNAAPVDVTWGSEHASRRRSDPLRLLEHKPINYLIPAFAEGKMTADQCLHVLRWLVENGGDMAAACANFRDMDWDVAKEQVEFGRSLKLMPHSVLCLLVAETDRAKLDGVASIICYLLAQGFNLPRCMPVLTGAPIPMGRDTHPEFVPLQFREHGCMARLMRSACPPSVLEAFLKQLRRRGATLTSPLEKGPRSLRRVYQYSAGRLLNYERDTLATQIWSFVVELYNDLLDPASWKPAYDGEVGDVWEAKLDLLDAYEGVDDSERLLLRSILAALRSIEARARAEGVPVMKRDARACWRELTAALPSSATSEQQQQQTVDPAPADRVHRFSLLARPDPDEFWDDCARLYLSDRYYQLRLSSAS